MHTLIIILFILGYTAIIFEHKLKVNKAGIALCMGILCWTAYMLFSGSPPETITHQINENMSEIAGVLFFLLGAMTIVEVVDAHGGFRFITDRIHTTDKRRLLWIISFITFFLSSVLDNLTTTIIMISLLSKLVGEQEDRWRLVAMVIIAANAGGAWTPIGDVTTTMLWVGGQVTTSAITTRLLLPSLVSMIVPLIIFTFIIKGNTRPPKVSSRRRTPVLPEHIRNSILFLGVALLISVPIFKAVTHLPPYAGMMLGVSILWIYTGVIYHRHYGRGLKKEWLSVSRALQHVEFSTILFFLGILLAVGALQCTGILGSMANWLDKTIGNQGVIVTVIGMISAVIDNVPLVAAAQGMYHFPTDSFFWEFLAYAAGTGGSMLIIGSAAGVAAMGLQKIPFLWYLRRVSLWALLGYLSGALVYIAESRLLS